MELPMTMRQVQMELPMRQVQMELPKVSSSRALPCLDMLPWDCAPPRSQQQPQQAEAEVPNSSLHMGTQTPPNS
jgi:hypothetical protein